MFGSPKVQTPPPPPYAPTRAEPSVLNRGLSELRKPTGKSRLTLTGPMGLDRKSTNKRTFLGGS